MTKFFFTRKWNLADLIFMASASPLLLEREWALGAVVFIIGVVVSVWGESSLQARKEG